MKNPPHSAVQNSAHLPSWGHVCWWRPYCVPAASPSTQKPARWLRSERDTEQGCGDLLAPGRFSQTWLFSRLELLSGWRVQLVPINQINPLGAKDSAPRSNMGFFPHTQPFSATPAGCIQFDSILTLSPWRWHQIPQIPQAVLPARWLFIPFLICAQGTLLSGGVIGSCVRVCLCLCVCARASLPEVALALPA